MSDYDIIVIGSGPGGYVAALKAAQMGAKTAVVEAQPFYGGTCLNFGCIPSKALLAPAELMHSIRGASAYGLTVSGEVTFDWPAIQKRKDKVIAKLRGGIKGLFAGRKVDTYRGHGRLAGAAGAGGMVNGEADDHGPSAAGHDHPVARAGHGAHRVTVTDDKGAVEQLSAKNVILATGSTVARIPGWPDDPTVVCTSDEALHWKTLPKKLVIVGGGVIGCEFACMLQPMGVEVTIVEMMPRLLPEMEVEAADELFKTFQKRGIAIHVGAKVAGVETSGDGLTVNIAGGEPIACDRMLVAIGRRPATADVGLETVGIETQRGFVPVDDRMRTSAPGVYCIGDANGRCLLAHAASAQGVVAVENALGHDATQDKPIPWAVYTFPEIAGVGTTEARAKEKGIPVSIGMFPLGYLGKAMAAGHDEGFVKTIRNRETDALLGVHILGHNATEMIHAAAALIGTGAGTTALAETIFAHPTLSEGIKESAEDALGVALHMPPRKVVRMPADAR